MKVCQGKRPKVVLSPQSVMVVHDISNVDRGVCRTAATSKMEHFVIIVNGWKPLTIITKSSILDVAAVLDPPLVGQHDSGIGFVDD